MAFRDDLGAAQARADALERENLRLKAELEQRKAGDEELEQPESVPGKSLRAAAMIAATLLIGALGGVAAIALEQEEIFVATAVMTTATIVMILVVARLAVLPRPGAVIVLSGRRYTEPDGTVRSYRLVFDRTVLRIPVLESMNHIDTRPTPMQARVDNCYCKGGRPLSIEAAGTVRVRRKLPDIHEAIERFLGRGPAEFARVAGETVTGHIRAVVRELAPEEVTLHVQELTDKVLEEAYRDLAKLGLEIERLELSVSTDGACAG